MNSDCVSWRCRWPSWPDRGNLMTDFHFFARMTGQAQDGQNAMTHRVAATATHLLLHSFTLLLLVCSRLPPAIHKEFSCAKPCKMNDTTGSVLRKSKRDWLTAFFSCLFFGGASSILVEPSFLRQDAFRRRCVKEQTLHRRRDEKYDFRSTGRGPTHYAWLQFQLSTFWLRPVQELLSLSLLLSLSFLRSAFLSHAFFPFPFALHVRLFP